MDELLPHLHATDPAPLPFARTAGVRAFVLERRPGAGNLLLYSAPTAVAERDAIAALGGVAAQYLNHWHEAAFGGGAEVAAAVGAPVYVGAADRDEMPEAVPVAGVFGDGAVAGAGDGLSVLPIPGHTPGATAFLWDSGAHRMLFTGDSVMLDGDDWVVAVLGSSDREAYAASLERLREVEFDVLVPWAAGLDGPAVAVVGAAEARRRLGDLVARVRGGASR